ncbi:MAG: PKD domain-containing protein [Bacteroidales bacterium]|nr:PKD domain-containing protein [Bacteroidales bacterium]
MKTKNVKINWKIFTLIALIPLFALTSCEPEEEVLDPVASFQYEVSADNFLEVSFTNFSQNADTYSWDFGDDETSTEESPTHAYAEVGNYTVILTASNADGISATYEETIEIVDPNEALTLLTGEVSKTWKLYRVGNSMGVGPSLEAAFDWFALENDGSRPCVYYHEFTFTRDGDYIFDDKGVFWGEGLESGPKCIEATAENLVNADGVDVSAWLGGTHAFEYDPSTGMITLTGEGAWMGLPKTATTGEVAVPQNSVTFKVEITEEDGFDLMNVQFIYDWGAWVFNYASYSTATEPDVVSFFVDFSYEVDDFTVTFTNESKDATSYSWDFGDGNTSTEENPTHTYAAEGSYDVVLTGTGATGDKEATKNITISLNPETVATAPTEPEANVISIYSDAYTDITGVNIDPDWGQATVTEEIDVADEKVIKMTGLNYQGIDWADNAQDVSGKTTLHVDIYTASVTDINLSVIGGGAENPVTLTTDAGVWKSFDIALSEYTSPDLSAVIQVKFDDAGTGSSPTIFVDNIYFY